MQSKKKILVELLHGLGDTVCAIPMLKVLREHYQEARIDVVCKFDVCAQILRCSDIKIDNYYVLNVYSNPLRLYIFQKEVIFYVTHKSVWSSGKRAWCFIILQG